MYSIQNWRKQLEINDRKTHCIVAIFVAIYCLVGLLIDLSIYQYPTDVYVTNSTAFWNLITFRVIPFATLVSFAVAWISILIAYTFHDKIIMLGTKYKLITSETISNRNEKIFYNVIEELKIAAGLSYAPKLFVIEAPYMNAFASGYSEKSALIAVTSGLLEKLNRSELQAVIAHELSHIRHHDIKLTMAIAITCNLLLIAVDILFRSVLYGSSGSSGRNRRERSSSEGGGGSGGANAILSIIIIALRISLPIFTLILMLFLNRTREFMADAGAVELMRDNQPLANALIKIAKDSAQNTKIYASLYQNMQHENIRKAAYIFLATDLDRRTKSFTFTNLFSTHPPLESRLAALGVKHFDSIGAKENIDF